MRLSAILTATLALSHPAVADDLDTQAAALFQALRVGGLCPADAQDRPAPTRRSVLVPASGGEQPVTTFEFDCGAGAYNMVRAFLIHTDPDGLRPLSFAIPVIAIDQTDAATALPRITGYRTALTLINPLVDEATGRIVTGEKWRGVGDAGTSGSWDLTDAGYVLRSFQVDATYDGQVNPVSVLEPPDPARPD